MLLQPSNKTNWFHILVIVIVAGIGIYYIKQAMEKPFAQWQAVNEVRAAEIKVLLNE